MTEEEYFKRMQSHNERFSGDYHDFYEKEEESEKESKMLNTLEDAVNVFEHWKWNMYTDDDEVGIAVQSIKELIEELKNK